MYALTQSIKETGTVPRPQNLYATGQYARNRYDSPMWARSVYIWSAQRNDIPHLYGVSGCSTLLLAQHLAGGAACFVVMREGIWAVELM